VAALEKLMEAAAPRESIVNLGTGRGHSVLEVVRSFEAASGKAIPFEVVARRPGDAAICYADVSRARELLDWRAQRELATMCADAWRWQAANPDGFGA
jgi:UDP-glucose 4-epimerase